MLQLSAYIDKGQLHIVGLDSSPLGLVPFTYKRKVSGNPPDGPVAIGAEDTHPAVSQALTKSEGPIMHQLETAKMQKAACDLIERARAGEQNAVATLMEIRDNAKKGDPRSQASYKILINFARNPASAKFSGLFDDAVSTLTTAVSEAAKPAQYAATVTAHLPNVGASIDSSMQAATALANGPRITPQLLGSVQAAVTHPDAKAAFALAVRHSGDLGKLVKAAKVTANPEVKKAIHMGYTLGTAKRIQDVRLPDYPIKHFSAMAAWELGE